MCIRDRPHTDPPATAKRVLRRTGPEMLRGRSLHDPMPRHPRHELHGRLDGLRGHVRRDLRRLAHGRRVGRSRLRLRRSRLTALRERSRPRSGLCARGPELHVSRSKVRREKGSRLRRRQTRRGELRSPEARLRRRGRRRGPSCAVQAVGLPLRGRRRVRRRRSAELLQRRLVPVAVQRSGRVPHHRDRRSNVGVLFPALACRYSSPMPWRWRRRCPGTGLLPR